MQRMKTKCLLCWLNKRQPMTHSVRLCEHRHLAENQWNDVKKHIRFEPYSACFACFLPQEICGCKNRSSCTFRDSVPLFLLESLGSEEEHRYLRGKEVELDAENLVQLARWL